MQDFSIYVTISDMVRQGKNGDEILRILDTVKKDYEETIASMTNDPMEDYNYVGHPIHY